MNGKDHGHGFGDVLYGFEYLLEHQTIVDVRRAVQGHHDVSGSIHSESRRHIQTIRLFSMRKQRVDHHIPDEMNLLRIHTLPFQVFVGFAVGREQVIGQGIGDHPIDLLGHRAIEATQSRFDMRHGYLQFCRHQRTGHRGVHVSDDNDQVRPVCLACFLKFDHDPGSLDCKGGRSNAEVDVGGRN